MGNHESWCSPAEAASDKLDFMQKIKKKVSETNQEKIHYQYESSPCLLNLSLQTNFGDERGNGNHHLHFHTGHKIGHSCSDSVCRWNRVASNVDFQK